MLLRWVTLKKDFDDRILPDLKIKDISIWNRYNSSNLIKDSKTGQNDTIHSTDEFSEAEKELEPYRKFESMIFIEKKPFLYSERINLVESEDLIMSIAFLFISLFALLLVGILLITNRLSRRIWKPFYLLIEQIEAFNIDENTLPDFSPTTIEEFDQLNRGLKHLMQRNIGSH